MSLQASWQRTAEHLRAVRSMLSVSDSQLQDFTDYLEHNELELALDELAAVALEAGAPPKFWRKARDAALEMGLNEHVRRYGEQLRANSPHG